MTTKKKKHRKESKIIKLTADLPSAFSHTSLNVVADRIDPSSFPVAFR